MSSFMFSATTLFELATQVQGEEKEKEKDKQFLALTWTESVSFINVHFSFHWFCTLKSLEVNLT